MTAQWVLLGHVRRAHGIQGGLLIGLFNPGGKTLRVGLSLKFNCLNKDPQILKIKKILGGSRIFLENIETRNQSEELLRAEIYVKREDFIDLDPDELYLTDLLDFEVFDLQNKKIGSVTGFSDNTAQNLIEIDNKLLVPFVKPILVKIDEESKKIVLDIPEGL